MAAVYCDLSRSVLTRSGPTERNEVKSDKDKHDKLLACSKLFVNTSEFG
jgi:hypothetical protein